MAVVVVGLGIMIGSAVAIVTPASSFVGSGPSEDRAKNEALSHGKSAQTNPDSYWTKEESLHCGTKSCDQNNTKRQGMLHSRLFVV